MVVAPRAPEVRTEDSPLALTKVRGAGGGTMARADAAGGAARPVVEAEVDRPLSVAAAAAAFVLRVLTAAVSRPLDAPETVATELAGTLEFTKRCSLASYTIEDPAATCAAALESTVRAIRAGAATTLAFADGNASFGACFTTFHFVAPPADAFSAPPRPAKGITPCPRFNAVFP